MLVHSGTPGVTPPRRERVKCVSQDLPGSSPESSLADYARGGEVMGAPRMHEGRAVNPHGLHVVFPDLAGVAQGSRVCNSPSS